MSHFPPGSLRLCAKNGEKIAEDLIGRVSVNADPHVGEQMMGNHMKRRTATHSSMDSQGVWNTPCEDPSRLSAIESTER